MNINEIEIVMNFINYFIISEKSILQFFKYFEQM
jgi:hypothetical protein